MSRAIYAVSADPITYGHIDIIERAARKFDEVIFAIGINPGKKYTFTTEERVDMAKKVLAYLPNVKVVSFEGTLVDYAWENNFPTLIRGVRDMNDFQFEKDMFENNLDLAPDVDTILLFATPELGKISSSSVKGFQSLHEEIHTKVPLYVKQRLEERLSGQYLLGVTGEIGCGKSYVSQKFVEIGKQRGIEVHNIELDHVAHRILDAKQCPHEGYQLIRQKLADTFGKQIMLPDGSIDRKVLGDIVFTDEAKLAELNSIMQDPIKKVFKKELINNKGLLLYNVALLAEMTKSYVCNNNVLLVYADKPTQEKRLIARDGPRLMPEQIKRRMESQFSFEQKKSKLEEQIEKDRNGKIFVLDNSEEVPAGSIEKMFDKIVKELKIK